MIEKKTLNNSDLQEFDFRSGKVKFEVYGHEMIEKIVKSSGNSGRIYLPPDWIGSKVKIVKIE